MYKRVKEQIKTMLALQDELNSKIHPDWRSQNYPWYRAIWVECAELMDHHGYKWWKKQETNLEQVKLELVDIFHFILSNELTKPFRDKEHLASVMAANYVDALKLQSDPFVFQVERIVYCAIKMQDVPPMVFFILMKSIDMGMDELFNMYVGKFALNKFRQDKGYNTGRYRKTWAGKEDNEHLTEILAQVGDDEADPVDLIYKKLEDRYALSLIV